MKNMLVKYCHKADHYDLVEGNAHLGKWVLAK